MTEPLKTMITVYKNKGERVDEVLFQEVMKTIERAQELEVVAEGYRSNWYKCVNDKTGSNQELQITPKGSVNAPWG